MEEVTLKDFLSSSFFRLFRDRKPKKKLKRIGIIKCHKSCKLSTALWLSGLDPGVFSNYFIVLTELCLGLGNTNTWLSLLNKPAWLGVATKNLVMFMQHKY